MTPAEVHPETMTADVELAVGGRRLKARISVPVGPMRPLELVPLARSLTEAVVGGAVEDVLASGQQISCKKGCGACCRQLVPLAPAEAQHLRDLVETLPEPRRSEIRARFAAARRRLEAAGWLDLLLHPDQWPEERDKEWGLKYFFQGIPCPFLEEESCSIYPERPLACREYLVTSPAEHCAQPQAGLIHGVKIALKLLPPLARAGEAGPPASRVPWVPLIVAPEWAEAHPEPPTRPGPELLRRFFEELTSKELPPPGLQAPTGEPAHDGHPASQLR